jgi:hypothetical protein
MKFIIVFFVLSLNLMLLTVNAQVFIGGDLSISSSRSKSTNNNSTLSDQSGFSFNLAPNVGKFLSDKVAIGISTDISGSYYKEGTDHINRSKGFMASVNPFIRYYFIEWNKFSVFGMGITGIGYSQSKNFADGTLLSKTTGSTYSINFYPGLSYALSDKIALESEIGLLSLGYSYVSSKNGSSKYHSSNFNFSGRSSIGVLSIGAIYKFIK